MTYFNPVLLYKNENKLENYSHIRIDSCSLRQDQVATSSLVIEVNAEVMKPQSI